MSTNIAKKYIGITLALSEVKLALYEQNAKYFKDALLRRLADAAKVAGHYNWRCVGEDQDLSNDSVTLIFEEAPDSHPETLLTHQINRLLEAI